MDTAWILIGSYLTPRERIILSRADRNLHSLFSSHTENPHWLTSNWADMELKVKEGITLTVIRFFNDFFDYSQNRKPTFIYVKGETIYYSAVPSIWMCIQDSSPNIGLFGIDGDVYCNPGRIFEKVIIQLLDENEILKKWQSIQVSNSFSFQLETGEVIFNRTTYPANPSIPTIQSLI